MAATDTDLREHRTAFVVTDVKRSPETKTFLASSEFWVFAAGVAALLFAAYVADDITNAQGWQWATWVTIAYIVSRGIAKSGSTRSWEPLPGVHDGQRTTTA